MHKTRMEDAPQIINFWYYASFQYKAPRRSFDDIKIDLFLPLTLRKNLPQVEKSLVKIRVKFIAGIFSKIQF